MKCNVCNPNFVKFLISFIFKIIINKLKTLKNIIFQIILLIFYLTIKLLKYYYSPIKEVRDRLFTPQQINIPTSIGSYPHEEKNKDPLFLSNDIVFNVTD